MSRRVCVDVFFVGVWNSCRLRPVSYKIEMRVYIGSVQVREHIHRGSGSRTCFTANKTFKPPQEKNKIFCKYAYGYFIGLELKLINLQFLLHREHSVLITQTK